MSRLLVRPAEVIEKLKQNDPGVTEIDLSANATYEMKSTQFTTEIAETLKTNTHLKKLVLSKLDIAEAAATKIGEALAHNSSIIMLDLSNNKFGNAALSAIAESLKTNETLVELNVIGQSQPFGEAALAKMVECFETNITLQKITWRLHSRQSFALNKCLIRNVDIQRRLKDGLDVEDLLPMAKKTGAVKRAEYTPEPSAETPAENADG